MKGANRDRDGRMRVWHLMGPLRPSGMERMFVSAAPYWANLGVDGTILGQGDDHPFAPELEAVGYQILAIEPIRSLSGARALTALLKAERPDVLHIHAEGAFAFSVAAARCAGVPIVRTVHNTFPVRGRAAWSRRVQAWVSDRYVDAFVAPSGDVAERERAIGRELEVILNWVADDFVEADPPQGVGEWAVIVGNASPIKNHVLALRALLRTDIHLAYIGSLDGASVEEIAILDELEAKGRLLHRGSGDPLPWLLTAAVFLMPSRHEGMPVALAEALQLGLPAVIAPAPGLAWAADIEGVIVAVYDVEEWAAAIAIAVAAGRNRERTHPDFTAARGAGEYAAVYRAALASTRGS